MRMRQWVRWMGMALLVQCGAVCAADKGSAVQTVLVLGDSLSAGYGLPAGSGWVSLLQRRLDAEGRAVRVVNASISGDTTAGGLSRLPAALAEHRPQIVLIELGANDGLRGLPVPAMRANLAKLVALAKAARAQPVLMEMRIPSNYGAPYTAQFTATFAELARAEKIPLVPFFLAAIATDPARFQDDGLHPNAGAQPALLDAVWPTLALLLKSATLGR
jgi:acyl-CoA thioesterase I